MRNLLIFGVDIFLRSKKHEVYFLASELTYKIILSVFPFVIFLMTFTGFLNIDIEKFIYRFDNIIPNQILELVGSFIQSNINVKHVGLMSWSLIISIYSSSSGFKSVIRGINRSYEKKETRNIILVRLISIFLVFIFCISIIISFAILVYGDYLISFLNEYSIIPYSFEVPFKIISFLFTVFLLIVLVTFIYKISSCLKIRFYQAFPGAIFTVLFWIIFSKLYNFYLQKFSNFSKLYGSISNVFVFLIWINILSIILLIGSEINSLLSEKRLVYKKNIFK